MEKFENGDIVRYDWKYLSIGHSEKFPTYSLGYGIAKESKTIFWHVNSVHRSVFAIARCLPDSAIFVKKWHSKNHGKIINWCGSIANPYDNCYLRFWKLYLGFRTPKWITKIKRAWEEYKMDEAALQDPHSLRCDRCGSHRLREAEGFAGEPHIFCKDCGVIIYAADPTPYII